MSGRSLLDTSPPFFSRFFRVLVFLVRICSLFAEALLIRPEAVTRKRLLAAFRVFILGMFLFYPS